MLTGLYAHQAGIGHMADKDRGTPAYSGDLSKNAVTIAEVLKRSGYYTAMTGKWHVTKHTKEGGPETYGSYGVRWANVSNAPFRLHKSWLHEGGISTPFIMHWPNGLKQKGITHQTGHIIDIMPTILNIAKAEYPSNFNGNKITPPEGKI